MKRLNFMKESAMNLSDLFSISRAKWQADIVPFPTTLKNIQSIQIEHLNSAQKAQLNQKEIHTFLSFMKKGSCNKMLKGATRYQIIIEHEGGLCNYYIHGDALGPEPGGLVQASFEPRKRGFEVFLHSFFQVP